MPKLSKYRWWQVLLLVALVLPLFLHLGKAPVNAWDEALFAMRAAYMAEEGRYLPDYDHWISKGAFHPNSKPPFTTWIQVVFLKAMGINELALRLPVALAATCTLLLFIWFFQRKMHCWQAGWTSAFVLSTTLGYVREHAARTGDHDAPLALYMSMGVLAFYLLLDEPDKKARIKWWMLLTASAIAAVLTKYLFGAVFWPALALYAIYKGKLSWLLRQRALWMSALLIVLICGGWVAWMEMQHAGFAERVLYYEMLHRYTTVIEEHRAPWHFFLTQFWTGHFQPWLWLLPLPLAMLFFKANSRMKDLTLLLVACVGIHLLVISSAQTKLPHYDVVAYPLLAMLTGIGLWNGIELLYQNWSNSQFRPVIAGLTIAGVLRFGIQPYVKVIDQVWNPIWQQEENKYGYLFRVIETQHGGLKKFKVVAPVFEAQAVYYAGLYNRCKGYQIELEDFPKRVEPGDTIMACNRTYIDYLFQNYQLQGLATYEHCFVARVECRKSPDTKAAAKNE